MPRTSSPANAPRPRGALLRIGALALLVAIGTFVAHKLGWFDYSHTLAQIQRIRRSQNAAVFVPASVAAYAVLTSLGLPGMPLNVAAGVLLGGVIGGAIAWTGSVLGAVIGYWVARTVGHNEVLRFTRRYRRMDAAVEQARDFPGMLRWRLIPVLPIGVVNFVGGLARAPFGAYLAATALGIVPSVTIYSYFADSLVAGVGSGRRQAVVSLFIASALLILLSLVPRLFRGREERDGRRGADVA
jgi:uncharacterized membrane protein YdjX (TVP38/TMEM64 family)